MSVYDWLPKDTDGDGWILDQVVGLNPYDDALNALPELPKAPDPVGWVSDKLERTGEYGRENLPGVARAAGLVGVGMAGAGAITLLGTGATIWYTLYLLGNSRNVSRAIQALDPAELARAANPFGQGRK